MKRQSGDVHRDDERRRAEERAIQRIPLALLAIQIALAERAAGGDEHRFVRTEQQERREIDGVRHRHRRATGGERQMDLQCRRR